jgi:hypothetical protein
MSLLSAPKMWLEAFIVLHETAQHSIDRAVHARIHPGFLTCNLSSYYRSVGAWMASNLSMSLEVLLQLGYETKSIRSGFRGSEG